MSKLRIVGECLAIPVLLFSSGLVGGCASTTTMHASKALPNASLQDIATYSDKLALLEAVSEKRVEPTAEELKRGEGTATRLVTLLVVNDLWTSKGAKHAGSTGELPQTIEVANGGWIFNQKNERRLLVEGDADLEVGKRYVSPLAYSALSTSAENPQSWLLINTIPLTDAGTLSGDGFSNDQESLEGDIRGKTPEEVAELLTGSAIDERAAEYLDEDPYSRYQHVLRDEAEGQPEVRAPFER